MIYGENSNMYSGLNTYSFALLEDNDNFYLYQFLMGSTSSKTACYTFAKSDVPNMHKDQLFAIASSRPYYYMQTGVPYEPTTMQTNEIIKWKWTAKSRVWNSTTRGIWTKS